ncbi:hypothetical protein Tco_0998313 [Tanacetum coccineum]
MAPLPGRGGTHPSLIRVPVTIKTLDLTNLYIIFRVNHNNFLVKIAGIASTQTLVDAVTVALPSPLLPPLLPFLYIPPPVDRRDDIPESELPPRKRSCLFALGSSEYGIQQLASELQGWICDLSVV